MVLNRTMQLRKYLDFRIDTNHFSYVNKVTENCSKFWNSLPQNFKMIYNRKTFKSDVHYNYIDSY